MGNKGLNTSSSNSTSQNIYNYTSTKNPYVKSTTFMGGTKSDFAPNSALEYVNKFASKNMGSLINDYLKPSLNNDTNKYLMENYRKNLSKNAAEILNNDIIGPLADRNMLRSSQATALYQNLNNSLADKVGDYQASLMENTSNEAGAKLQRLYDMYLNGYNVISGNQAQSLQTSAGSGTQSGSSNTTSFGM